jgi:hypothetical protein
MSGLNINDPQHLISVVHFHEIRGALSQAYEAVHNGVQSFQFLPKDGDEVNTMFYNIYLLCDAYFCCYTRGRWTEALQTALKILNQLDHLDPRLELNALLQRVSKDSFFGDDLSLYGMSRCSFILRLTLSRFSCWQLRTEMTS